MTVREVLRVSFRPFLERTKEARMNLLLRRKSKIYYFSLFALLQTCNHLCNFFLPSPLESLVRSIVQRRTFTLKVNSVTGIVFIFRDKIRLFTFSRQRSESLLTKTKTLITVILIIGKSRECLFTRI